MKRKDFIHHAAMAAAGSMLLPLANCKTTPMVIRKNWAGNYQYQAKNLYTPQTVEETQSLVAWAISGAR